VVERWFTPEFRASNPDAMAKAQRMLENTTPEGYAACCAAVRDMDQSQEIASIKSPTLVVYGGSDPVIPIPEAQFLSDHIPGAIKVELAAAHLSNVEQATAFTQAVSNFLAGRNRC
jgi:3-oxoadipate enol-lactonase